jgi:hypothetical protein
MIFSAWQVSAWIGVFVARKDGGFRLKKNPTIQFYGWNMTIKKSMKNILNTFKYNIIIIVEYYGQMKYEDY